MSETVLDRQQRQETLKKIIRDLHAGVSLEQIKQRFGALLDQVGATEIGELEQSLIAEGLPVEEIQKLCDVHVAVFKESLEKQQAAEKQEAEDPLHSLKQENEQITTLVQDYQKLAQEIAGAPEGAKLGKARETWLQLHEQLSKITTHYAKKENILFPYLERHGISGPPSVMWGIHDEIRAALKQISELLGRLGPKQAAPGLTEQLKNLVAPTLETVSEMVYKEERILFPMCQDTFSTVEWQEIAAQLKDPMATVYKTREEEPTAEGAAALELEIGALTPEQVNLMLTHLPVDLTFVDEKDEVAYFSLGPERIFERTRAVIGRKVQFCHPPSSMAVVEQILQDFKSGKKDAADFWINLQGKLIYIRYFAVRDQEGNYRGTLEVTQNITEIQKITGQQRLYDYGH